MGDASRRYEVEEKWVEISGKWGVNRKTIVQYTLIMSDGGHGLYSFGSQLRKFFSRWYWAFLTLNKTLHMCLFIDMTTHTHINLTFQLCIESCIVLPSVNRLPYKCKSQKCVWSSAVEMIPTNLAKQESTVGYMQKHAWHSCIVEQEYVIVCSRASNIKKVVCSHVN